MQLLPVARAQRRAVRLVGPSACRVAAGLGLLLALALAGCTAASPSGSQTPVVAIAAGAESTTTGDPVQFQVRAEPAPAADLTVGVTIVADGCTLAQSPESVTIPAGAPVATLTVPITGEVSAQGCVVTATIIDAGAGYVLGGDDDAASLTRSVTVTVNDAPGTLGTPGTQTPGTDDSGPKGPSVTIDRVNDSAIEGGRLRFELTADPAPAVPLTVNVRWDDPGGWLSRTPPRTIMIPTSGKAIFSEATTDDNDERFDQYRHVSVTIVDGSGYVVGSPRRAGIIVYENDNWPRVSVVADVTLVDEGEPISFTLTATPVPTSASGLTVNLHWIVTDDRLTGTPPKTVKIPAHVPSVRIPLGTKDDLIDNYAHTSVGVLVDAGDRYYPGRPNTAVIGVLDDEFTPVVTIDVDATPTLVTEGNDIEITLTAAPPEDFYRLSSPVTVNLKWSIYRGRNVNEGNPPPDTVTIPAPAASAPLGTAGTATVTLRTRNNNVPDGNYTVRVDTVEGEGYFHSSPRHVIVTVDDDETP